MEEKNGRKHVVIVGGGFAGLGCARTLASRKEVRVTLIDKNNYHQFQPLLYQVATSMLAPDDIAVSLRKLFRTHPNVDVKLAAQRHRRLKSCCVPAIGRRRRVQVSIHIDRWDFRHRCFRNV